MWRSTLPWLWRQRADASRLILRGPGTSHCSNRSAEYFSLKKNNNNRIIKPLPQVQIALFSISRCSLKLRLCHTCKFLALPRLVHHLPLCTPLLFWSSNEVPQTHKPGTRVKDASSLLIKPERRSCHSLRNDSNEKDKEPPCEFVRWLTPFKFCVCYLWREKCLCEECLSDMRPTRLL